MEQVHRHKFRPAGDVLIIQPDLLHLEAPAFARADSVVNTCPFDLIAVQVILNAVKDIITRHDRRQFTHRIDILRALRVIFGQPAEELTLRTRICNHKYIAGLDADICGKHNTVRRKHLAVAKDLYPDLGFNAIFQGRRPYLSDPNLRLPAQAVGDLPIFSGDHFNVIIDAVKGQTAEQPIRNPGPFSRIRLSCGIQRGRQLYHPVFNSVSFTVIKGLLPETAASDRRLPAEACHRHGQRFAAFARDRFPFSAFCLSFQPEQHAAAHPLKGLNRPYFFIWRIDLFDAPVDNFSAVQHIIGPPGVGRARIVDHSFIGILSLRHDLLDIIDVLISVFIITGQGPFPRINKALVLIYVQIIIRFPYRVLFPVFAVIPLHGRKVPEACFSHRFWETVEIKACPRARPVVFPMLIKPGFIKAESRVIHHGIAQRTAGVYISRGNLRAIGPHVFDGGNILPVLLGIYVRVNATNVFFIPILIGIPLRAEGRQLRSREIPLRLSAIAAAYALRCAAVSVRLIVRPGTANRPAHQLHIACPRSLIRPGIFKGRQVLPLLADLDGDLQGIAVAGNHIRLIPNLLNHIIILHAIALRYRVKDRIAIAVKQGQVFIRQCHFIV